MFEHLYFESERLLTKQLKKEDAPTLFHLYSDEEAMKYRRSRSLNEREEAYAMIDNQWVTNSKNSTLRSGIWNKSTNQLLGTLLLTWEYETNNHCEIGFSFGKEHWNKGFGKETLSMVEKKLRQRGIKTLTAWCMKANLASNKIFEKAGFTLVKQTQHPQSNLFSKNL